MTKDSNKNVLQIQYNLLNLPIIRRVIVILFCLYALFGASMNAMLVLAFSLQNFCSCIIHFYPSFVFKNLFVFIAMLTAFGIEIKIKNVSSFILLIVLFLIAGVFLIEDVKYVLYEINIYRLNNRRLYGFLVMPCVLRVIFYFYSMVVIGYGIRKT